MYQPGDVVLCKFPYQDNPTKYKSRPALVLSDLSDGDYLLAQITSTDRRGELTGLWVLKDSKEGVQMGIRNDSFINLSNVARVRQYVINRLIGSFPDMDAIEDMCKENGIDLF